MLRKIRYIIIWVLVIGLYIGFRYYEKRDVDAGNLPEIKVPADTLELSDKDPKSSILEGISAYDTEDGDLTSSLHLESLSNFGEGNVRLATFGVFDSDDNYVQATRTISYTDYKKPKITLKKSFVTSYISDSIQYLSYVKATSSVDGNISSNIFVEREYKEDGDTFVTFKVADSTGTTNTLTLSIYRYKKSPNIAIYLKKYMITLKKGASFNPNKYIDNVVFLKRERPEFKELIEIDDGVDTSKKGTYDVIYRISRENDDYGVARLIVKIK